jgi:transcriptional regulator with XRE-family HTH domain
MGLRVKPDLASRIRDARYAADLSQKDLAEHLGVSARTVQYWEAGKTPYPKHRRAIKEFIAFVNCEEAA